MLVSTLAAIPLPYGLAALLIALRLLKGERSIACAVVAAPLVVLLIAFEARAEGASPLSVFVAAFVSLIGLIVAAYATRSMQGSSVSYREFFALFATAAAGSLTIAVATDLRVLALAWIATGWCTSGLLRVASYRSEARRWALRHVAIERVGDAAWIVVLAATWKAYHTFDLSVLARSASAGSTTNVIALALVLICITRSALVPFHAWLPNAMESPTPVSAFMHAGLVNGAGILLAKTAHLVVLSPIALTFAVVLGGCTAALGATIASVRPETKRRLGWSTVAQMGFMVVQCGCGAFSAAIVHLVAHGGYKSTAFLGAAGSIDEYRPSRGSGTTPASAMHPAMLAIVALTPASLGLAAAWILFGDRIRELPAAALVLAVVWASGTSAARRCAERAFGAWATALALLIVAVGVPTYLVCVMWLDAWLGSSMPHFTLEPLTAAAAGVFIVLGLIECLGLRPHRLDALYALALTEGQAAGFPAP